MFTLNEYNKNIGNRVKELRELSDITIQDFAEELDIDETMYKQYENGEVDIPASFLCEIANKFQVDLGLLLTGEETRMNIFDVTRADKGISVERRKEYKYENLCTKFIDKKAEIFIVTVDPKEDAVPSLNSHPGQEFNYVLEGSLKFYIHNNEITLREGNRLMRFTSFISPLFLISMLEKRYFLFIIIGELVTSIIIANFSINTYQNETIVHKKKFFDVYFNIINNLPNILIGILICMYVINIFSSLIPNYIKPLSIILEITNGLKNLKVYEKYEYLYNYLLLSLVTLTGVAIMLQIYWIIKKTDISFKNYLKYRIIALLIGIILTSIYNLFLFKFFF